MTHSPHRRLLGLVNGIVQFLVPLAELAAHREFVQPNAGFGGQLFQIRGDFGGDWRVVDHLVGEVCDERAEFGEPVVDLRTAKRELLPDLLGVIGILLQLRPHGFQPGEVGLGLMKLRQPRVQLGHLLLRRRDINGRPRAPLQFAQYASALPQGLGLIIICL